MKRVLFSILLLPFVSMAQQKGFVINGSLTGLANNSLVFLTDLNNPTDTIAKSVAKNNSFTLKGAMPEPGLCNLNFAATQKKVMLFLDNSTVTLSGNSADIQKTKIEGSPSNKDFQDFQDRFTQLFAKLNQINEQSKTTGMTSSLSAQGIQITREIQDGVDKFLKEKKGSYVSPFLVMYTSQLSDDVTLLENRYNGFADNQKKSFYGQAVKETLDIAKIGAIGSNAIEFTQNDPDGKPVSLSSFRGKYVLIDFWASWCMPCRQENPNVVNTYKKFKDKNFTVLGVSLDRSRDPWLQAIKNDNLSWTHVSDLKFWNNEVAQKYRVQGIPQNFLIDPNGKIIAKNLRGPQLAQRLSELVK